MSALLCAFCYDVLDGSKSFFFVGGNMWITLKYQIQHIVKVGATFSLES
jgi:hypothetical protein